MVHAADSHSHTTSALLSRDVASRSKEAVKQQAQHAANRAEATPPPDAARGAEKHAVDVYA